MRKVTADLRWLQFIASFCCPDNLPLWSGVQVKVVGMGKSDEMLYATFPGNYIMPLGWPGTCA